MWHHLMPQVSVTRMIHWVWLDVIDLSLHHPCGFQGTKPLRPPNCTYTSTTDYIWVTEGEGSWKAQICVKLFTNDPWTKVGPKFFRFFTNDPLTQVRTQFFQIFYDWSLNKSPNSIFFRFLMMRTTLTQTLTLLLSSSGVMKPDFREWKNLNNKRKPSRRKRTSKAPIINTNISTLVKSHWIGP